MRTRNRFATAFGLTLGIFLTSGAVSPGNAYTESTLEVFCASGPPTCANGTHPSGPVLKSGNKIYGVSGSGGANDGGVVWQYNLNNGNYKVLYDFCSVVSGGVCTDGQAPTGGLIIDTSGNLYGTTRSGGTSNNEGTAWELVKSGATWTLQTLYSFCPSSGCADGATPESGLSYAGQSSGAYNGTATLYGTTSFGGGTSGDGTAFRLVPSGGSFTFSSIYQFCPSCTTCTNCSDGINPAGPLALDGSGDIIGTTASGGSDNRGVAWELTPGGGSFSETILYNFCWAGATKCLDGRAPGGGVILDSSANIFGTTTLGGSGQGSVGDGLVFKLTSGSSCTEGGVATFLCETVLYNFCPSGGCTDGSEPSGDIVFDSSGNLYGSTFTGGSSANIGGGAGTVWQLSGSTLTTAYAFCGPGFSSNCADGEFPPFGAIVDSSGTLYGSAGNPNGVSGTLWKITNP